MLVRRLMVVAAIVAFVCVLTPLSVLAYGDRVIDADVTVAQEVQQTDGPVVHAITGYGNWAGSTWGGLFIALPILGWLAGRRLYVEAALLGLVVVVRHGNAFLKWVNDSPRPSEAFVRVEEFANGLGFPSGHSMSSTLIFGALAFVVFRQNSCPVRRGFAVLVAVGSILATGFGRIYVGAHWPTDVLGGYLWGVLFLIAGVFIAERLAHHLPFGSTPVPATRPIYVPSDAARR